MAYVPEKPIPFIANKPQRVNLQRIEFTFSGLFTFDCFKSDRELAPVEMMAYFHRTVSGAVTLASTWIKTYPKVLEGLHQWVPTSLPRFQELLIEAQIEAGMRKEDREDRANVREVAQGY